MHTELEPELERKRIRPRGNARRYGLLGLFAVLVLCALFASGYLPRRSAEAKLVAEAGRSASEARRVLVAAVRRAPANSDKVLPGDVQAIDETPIYARADGYIRRWYADMGDRVRAGQVLAEIETPELDQQIRQSRAALEQTKAAALKSRAALKQSQTRLALAEITAKRWQALVGKGVLSKQDGDEKQAEYEAAVADVHAAEAAVKASDSDIGASEAGLQRLLELAAFRNVTAPFAGVMTARNIDTGTLITAGNNSGSKALYSMAQIDRLRIHVDVPQPFAPSVRVGQSAGVLAQEFPGRVFPGRVTRTSNSLDEKSHTLLAEVQVANPDHRLLPGMYVQVKFEVGRIAPPLVVPSDALMTRSAGTFVVAVENGAVRYRKVAVGRDYGPNLEIISGLEGHEQVVVNPRDDLKEGETVVAVPERE